MGVHAEPEDIHVGSRSCSFQVTPAVRNSVLSGRRHVLVEIVQAKDGMHVIEQLVGIGLR